MKNIVCAASTVSVLALSIAGLSPARAQTSPSATQATANDTREGGDIVVTGARGFAERLNDVPIAISSLSAEDIERQGIDDLADVAEKTVGFAYEAFTGPLAQPTIRGQTNLRTQSPVLNVASYLDGIYLQRGYLIDQSLLDLDRIEIIKGPQSSLYGRNSFAGVINLTTRKPDLDGITGKASGTVGTDKRYDAKATISIPLIAGKLAVLGSAAYSTFDGTWKNNHPLANTDGSNAFTHGNAGGYEKESYQLAVRGDFADVKLNTLYIHTQRLLEQVPTVTFGTAAAAYPFNTLNCSPKTLGGTTQNRLYCGELKPQITLLPGETRPAGLVDVDPRAYGLKGPTDVVSARAEFAPAGPMSVFAQFGYTYGAISSRGSGGRDPSYPVAAAGVGNTTFDVSGSGSSFKSYSGEGRATYATDRVRVFAGANYSNTSDILANGNEFAPINSLALPNTLISNFPIGPGLPFPSAVYQRGTYQKRIEDIWSFYGFAEVRPTDRLVVSLEGRYTIEDQQILDYLVRDAGAAGTVGGSIQALTTPLRKRTETYFTPRGSITYKFTRDNNVYAAVARGYKAGGFNGVSPVAPQTGGIPFAGQESYQAETNWTYEVGSKNRFSEIGLTLNVSAYYTDWKNLQSNAARLMANGQLPPQNNFSFTVTGNVGSVHVMGAELEGSWRMVKDVTLDFGVSYNNSRYTSDSFSRRIGIAGNCDGIVCSNANATPIGGNQLERVPKLDALLGATYETTFANGWKGFLRGDVTYQTKQFVDEANVAFVPGRTLANAAAGLDLGTVAVNLWIKNAFDKKYISSALFLIGTGGAGTANYTGILGDRRTVGLTGTVKF